MRHLRESLVLVLALVALGCGDKDGKVGKTGGDEAPTGTLPAELIVTAAPADAKDVLAVKKDAKEGDEVTILGVIGGDVKPFVDKRAVVTLVDKSVPSCKDNEGDGCPTPWDYCCVPPEELTAASATVQVLDADGKPLKVGLNAGAKLKPYDVVVVRGKVGPRVEGNLTINATAIYVQGPKN